MFCVVGLLKMSLKILLMTWESSGAWLQAWGLYTHMGDPERTPGSWLQMGSVVSIAVILGVNQ